MSSQESVDSRHRLLQDGLMTVEEVVAFLRLSRSTIYGLMERGELPYVCIGASRRIPRRAVLDLAERHLRGDIQAPAANNGATRGTGG